MFTMTFTPRSLSPIIVVLVLACITAISYIFYLIASDNTFSIIPSINGQDKKVMHEIARLNEAIRKQRALLEELACTVTKIGARGGFCLTEKEANVGGNYMWDLPMAIHLEESVLLGASVGDFGAGLGWYGRFWLRRSGTGIIMNGEEMEKKIFVDDKSVQGALSKPKRIRSWEGYDGAGNVEWITTGFIKYLDLSEPQILGKKYDWVVSLEVGEHIPQPFEATFIDNVCSHACIGVILSWAVEGQGGHFHVNNRNNSYVKEQLLSRGFNNDLELENKLRTAATLSHFKNTVMLFKRKTPIPCTKNENE